MVILASGAAIFVIGPANLLNKAPRKPFDLTVLKIWALLSLYL